MCKCSTVGCKNEAGPQVVRWDDYPDEPVCDRCARFYAALGGEFEVVPA